MPVLTSTIILFEQFMTAWEQVRKYKQLKPWIDVGINWATKYYKRMDDTKAYVIAMCKFFSWLLVVGVLATNVTFQSSTPLFASHG
jgi:hypothetical protein